MPEDTFSEKESFGCQPGREKGLWNAEIHQTAGIDTGIRNIHRAVAERGLQKSCLLMFGTYIAHWHSIGILASWIGEQECHQVYKEKKNPFLLDNQLPSTQDFGSSAGPLPRPTLLPAPLCCGGAHGLGGKQSEFKSHICCPGTRILSKSPPFFQSFLPYL